MYQIENQDRNFGIRKKRLPSHPPKKAERETKSITMTKSDLVNEISEKTGIEKVLVQTTVEALMKSVKNSLGKGENVYLRGFGSFAVKKRAEKTGRNISRNTTIIIPAHFVPSFKPAKTFVDKVKKNVKVSE